MKLVTGGPGEGIYALSSRTSSLKWRGQAAAELWRRTGRPVLTGRQEQERPQVTVCVRREPKLEKGTSPLTGVLALVGRGGRATALCGCLFHSAGAPFMSMSRACVRLIVWSPLSPLQQFVYEEVSTHIATNTPSISHLIRTLRGRILPHP